MFEYDLLFLPFATRTRILSSSSSSPEMLKAGHIGLTKGKRATLTFPSVLISRRLQHVLDGTAIILQLQPSLGPSHTFLE